jgi:dipeptidyl aminopeptidase/acylaminoacyl peptidase
LWIVSIFVALPVLGAAALVLQFYYLRHHYLDFILRCFRERPLFVIPRGEPSPDGELVHFPTTDGLTLTGCYLHHRQARRRGVILFGIEFGADCWSAVPYCEHLLDQGYDIFAFEPRSQGSSEKQPGYDALHWVTEYEVRDAKSAIAYLKSRPDCDPRGIGFFGISKGGSAGLIAAAQEPFVRCCITDGVFATRTTMIAYMLKWVSVVSTCDWLQALLPTWYYGLLADAGLRRMEQENGCRFPRLERLIGRLSPRPLLMIHGGSDTYITPALAQSLFARARASKELWLVQGAKHNQAQRTAGEDYRQRTLAFFEEGMAGTAV